MSQKGAVGGENESDERARGSAEAKRCGVT